MKRFILIFLLVAQFVFGALPTGLVWEIRSGGATTNGGGFNPANANMLTDATATSATGSAPVITSASYNFVAGDVGAWVYVKAGTNWTPGWYKISSVGSNAATVNGMIGAAIQVSAGKYIPNTVAGCATTASPTGGTFSVDYSQQDAAALSITDAVSVGSSTTMTSVAALFTPVMVGNLFHLNNAGTGSFGIVGWYEIVSYNSTSSVETDITTNTGTALAAGSGKVGGGILTLGAIGSVTARLGAVAGNIQWVKGSFTLGATDTLAYAGTGTNPIQIIGYGTLRGDGYLGRTAGAGLITTNMPAIAYSSTFKLNSNNAFVKLETLNITGTVNADLVTLTNDSIIKSCVVNNASTGASARTVLIQNRGLALDNDITESGASGSICAIVASGANTRIVGNRIKGGPGICINIDSSTAGCVIADNVIFAGVTGISVPTTSGGNIINNTIVGMTGDGIDVVTGATTVNTTIFGNMITDNGGYGIDLNAVTVGSFIGYNRFRDNTSGNINSGTGWVNATNFSPVTTYTGGAETDYVAAGSNDYRLIATSPATSASIPASASMGALQRTQTGGGQTSRSQ